MRCRKQCANCDLEYYVRECGEILGITPLLPSEVNGPMGILGHILKRLVRFKMLNQVRSKTLWEPSGKSIQNLQSRPFAIFVGSERSRGNS